MCARWRHAVVCCDGTSSAAAPGRNAECYRGSGLDGTRPRTRRASGTAVRVTSWQNSSGTAPMESCSDRFTLGVGRRGGTSSACAAAGAGSSWTLPSNHGKPRVIRNMAGRDKLQMHLMMFGEYCKEPLRRIRRQFMSSSCCMNSTSCEHARPGDTSEKRLTATSCCADADDQMCA